MNKIKKKSNYIKICAYLYQGKVKEMKGSTKDIFDIIISGDSMYPFLQNNEKVKVQTINPSSLVEGDVIVYQKFKEHPTVHRIIKKMKLKNRKLFFFTMGDNNIIRDNYIVHSHEILGKVIKEKEANREVERKLILLLSRVTFEEDVIYQIKEITTTYKLDWDYIMHIASINKVCTIVFKNIFHLCPGICIPKDIKRRYYCSKLKVKSDNEFIFTQVNQLIESLKNFDIFYLSLKEAWLLPNLYKDLSSRSIDDIEFLILGKDEKTLIKIMNLNGYFLNKKINQAKENDWRKKNLTFKKVIDKEQYPDIIFKLDLSLNEISHNMQVKTSNNLDVNKVIFFMHLCCQLYKEAKENINIKETINLQIIKFCDIREYLLIMTVDEIKEAIKLSRKKKIERAICFSCYFSSLIYNENYDFILECYEFFKLKSLFNLDKKESDESLLWKKSYLWTENLL